MVSISASARTHPGLVRAANEDSLLVADRLVAVADGLGGHAAGEVASGIVVQRLRELADVGEIFGVDDLRAAVRDANGRIVERAAQDPDDTGMATTVCGLALVRPDPGSADAVGQAGTGVAVFNVGDSRVYRWRSNELERVSVDHSEVQELIDLGLIDEAEAFVHPRRNVVTRCLGVQPAPALDVWLLPPGDGERYLLCSDGLTDEVEDGAISRALADHASPDAAADALVEMALGAGGRDNVTVVVADVRAGADADLPTTSVSVR